jgi:uncharacterized protein (DUF2141 family)
MKGRTVMAAMATSLALTAPAFANEGCEGIRSATSAKLVVQVGGIKSPTGEVAITVYPDDRRRFMAPGGKLLRERVKAAATVRTCFWLPPGSYAVAVYHDRDADQDFDRTMMGLPAEGFGFSNDPETKIGLPALSAARFRLPAGEKVLPIQMRYLR